MLPSEETRGSEKSAIQCQFLWQNLDESLREVDVYILKGSGSLISILSCLVFISWIVLDRISFVIQMYTMMKLTLKVPLENICSVGQD